MRNGPGLKHVTNTIAFSGFICLYLAINGYSFANLPGLNEVCRDRDVSWHLSALGGDTDQHTVYLRGNTVIWDDRRTDTVSLTPGNSVTVHMAARNKGTYDISRTLGLDGVSWCKNFMSGNG